MSKTVLIADDEPEIVELLRLFLEREKLTVLEACNGEEARERIEKEAIDLVILDIMMPKLDGYQLLRSIREKHKIPVMMLSAKNQDLDKILGLNLGADDFVSKPFNPLEVVARVQAQLRRSYEFNPSASTEAEENNHTAVGDLILDHHTCELYKRGVPIVLSSMEYQLLKMFMASPGRIFTKKQIFEQVWSERYVADDNTIMVHISRLREKIEDIPKQPAYLLTIRGLGYKFAKRTNPT